VSRRAHSGARAWNRKGRKTSTYLASCPNSRRCGALRSFGHLRHQVNPSRIAGGYWRWRRRSRPHESRQRKAREWRMRTGRRVGAQPQPRNRVNHLLVRSKPLGVSADTRIAIASPIPGLTAGVGVFRSPRNASRELPCLSSPPVGSNRRRCWHRNGSRIYWEWRSRSPRRPTRRDEPRQPALGCPPPSRRTAQARHRGSPGHGGQTPASALQNSLLDLAPLSAERASPRSPCSWSPRFAEPLRRQKNSARASVSATPKGALARVSNHLPNLARLIYQLQISPP
jgi:hypothetical protein